MQVNPPNNIEITVNTDSAGNPIYTAKSLMGTSPLLTPQVPTVLVTGGTGSFGRAYVEFLIERTNARVVVYSRDEHKQAELGSRLGWPDRLRFVIGDVRDEVRLREAFRFADSFGGGVQVVHAAALKTVPGGEQHGGEFTATNVLGTLNVARAALAAGVRNAVFVSTDKAAAPRNTYGITKALAERLWLQTAPGYQVVRGGNVWASAGSVVRVWLAAVRAGAAEILVTGPDSTRYHVEMSDWTAFVDEVRMKPHPGTISVPRLRAWRLGDLAEAFVLDVNSRNLLAQPLRARVMALRNGDKPHETLIAPGEIFAPGEGGMRILLNNPCKLSGENEHSELFTSESAERLSVEELRGLVSAFLESAIAP